MEPAMTMTDSGPSLRACAIASSMPSGTVDETGRHAERLREGGKIGDGGGAGIAGDAGQDNMGHRGQRICAIWSTALSAMAPKRSTSGRSPNCSARAARRAQAPAGLWATSRMTSGRYQGGGEALEAARPAGLARAATMLCGVMRKPCAASSSAAVMASARLRS